LLSNLLGNEVSSITDISTTPVETPFAKDNTSLNETNAPLPTIKRATEFSNMESNGIEIGARRIVKNQNFDEFVLSVNNI